MAWVASFFLVGFRAGVLRAGFAAGAFRSVAAGFASWVLPACVLRTTRPFGAASAGAFARRFGVAAGAASRGGAVSGEGFGVLGPAFGFRGPGPSFFVVRFGFSSMVLVPFGS
jgi:hypothetical protein